MNAHSLQVGDAVRARFGASTLGVAGTSWFAGFIVKIHDDQRCDVKYEDGDFEPRVLPKYIRLRDGQPAVPADPPPMCGTYGCILVNNHPGLHQFELRQGRARKRRASQEESAMDLPPSRAARTFPQGVCEKILSAPPPDPQQITPPPALKRPSDESRPSSAQAAKLVTGPSARHEGPLAVCEHMPQRGWYRLSRKFVLETITGAPATLEPGAIVKAKLPGCQHIVKLMWPSGDLGESGGFKFRLDSCKKCRALKGTIANVSNSTG